MSDSSLSESTTPQESPAAAEAAQSQATPAPPEPPQLGPLSGLGTPAVHELDVIDGEEVRRHKVKFEGAVITVQRDLSGEDPFATVAQPDLVVPADDIELPDSDDETDDGYVSRVETAIDESINENFAETHDAIDRERAAIDEEVSSGTMGPIKGWVKDAALGATDFSVSSGEGLVKGFWDIRNFGEGISEGSLEGLSRDLGRAANVVSGGKAGEILNVTLAAKDAVQSYQAGDVGGVAGAVGELGMAVLTRGKKRPRKKAKSRKRSRSRDGVDCDFVRKYRSKKVLSERQRAHVRKRVQELHDALDPGAVGRRTTAIVVVEAPDGSLVKLVASNRGPLGPKVRAKLRPPGEIEVPGVSKRKDGSPDDHAHHAEVNAIAAAVSSGYKIVEVFPSRPACGLCAQIRDNLRLPITDPAPRR